MATFDLQPTFYNHLIQVVPLKESDFESLYAVASDPLLWEQHPNKDRYKREVFETFFEGAINSKGAFLITEQGTGKIIGSSRYYDLNDEKSEIAVGYTFIGREFWGKGHNRALKTLMFNYAFQFVNHVILHVGATNFRSQKAVEKLGAKKITQIEVAYHGEQTKLNFVYRIEKGDWGLICN